jgi:hypothetical protein
MLLTKNILRAIRRNMDSCEPLPSTRCDDEASCLDTCTATTRHQLPHLHGTSKPNRHYGACCLLTLTASLLVNPNGELCWCTLMGNCCSILHPGNVLMGISIIVHFLGQYSTAARSRGHTLFFRRLDTCADAHRQVCLDVLTDDNDNYYCTS